MSNSMLDQQQIFQLAWDDVNKVLRTSASLSIGGGIEVAIDSLEDSITIGDEAGHKAVVSVDGALKVYGTQLDTINTSIGTTNTKLDTLASSQSTINTSIGTTNTKLDEVKAKQDTSNTHLNNINSGVGTTNTNLSAIANKLQRKPLVDYDEVTMTLSSGDTVETYLYKLSSVTVMTVVITYTDNTREVISSVDWS